MKNTLLGLSCAAVLALSSCGKDKNTGGTQTTAVDEQEVITQFVNVVGNPNYADIQVKATALNTSIVAFLAAPTDANLTAARVAWKNARQPWEQAEGFLFGPVEDNYYDPTMDSWPLNRTDVDALIGSTDALTFSSVDALDGFSKGFHGIEYIIFGPGGTRKAADITARQKDYLKYTSESLLNTTTTLRDSWLVAQPGGAAYASEIINAGKGSKAFTSRKDLFITIVTQMAAICEEVGTGKMAEPFTERDSTKDESSYSHNTTTDFINNIQGVLNVYTATYSGTKGTTSLSALVASKNAALDTKIKTQIQTALSSMALITPTFEKAIYNNRDKISNSQTALATLQATIEGDLTTFIQTNIKD